MRMERHRLRGKRVAILAADGFEYVELSVPRKALWLLGTEIEIVSLHRGRIRGMNITVPVRTVRVDRTLNEADPDDYDALFVPGGFVSPDFLRQSKLARAFVREFDAANKPIATLCHGPWLLVSAELVPGRRLASWPGIRDDIVHAGGIWQDEPVVHDRNWVSSRSPQDLFAFVPSMKELFASGPVPRAAEETALVPEEHRVSSPKPEAPSGAVVAAARMMPRQGLRLLAAAALGTAVGAFALRRASA